MLNRQDAAECYKLVACGSLTLAIFMSGLAGYLFTAHRCGKEVTHIKIEYHNEQH